MISFETLKSGFIQYLQSCQEKNPQKHYNIDSDNLSLFMYSDEFKDYLIKKIGCDSSIQTKSISDIMKMQFVGGKLVEPDSKEAINYIDEAKSLMELEIESQKTSSSQDNNAELSATESDFVSEDVINKYMSDNNIEITKEDSETFTDVFNILLTDKDFYNTVAGDSNKISEEQVGSFLNSIKGYDNNDSNLTFDDLLQAANDIQEGTFNPDSSSENVADKKGLEEELKSDEETTENEKVDTKADDEIDKEVEDEADVNDSKNESTESIDQTTSQPSHSSGSADSTFVAPEKYDSEGYPIVENMTLEELKQELPKAQSKLQEKQTEFDNIKTGTSQEILALKEQENQAKALYDEKLNSLDDETKEKLETARLDFENAQNNLFENKTAIQKQEIVKSQCNSNLSSLTSTLDTYNNQLQKLKEKNKDGKLNEKITSLEQKIKEVQTAKDQAQEAANKANDDYNNLQTENTKLNESLDKAKENLDNIEQTVMISNPDVVNALDNWKSAKENTINCQEQLLNTKQGEIQKEQNNVNKINEAINKAQTEQTLKDYSDNDGQSIVDEAYKYLGMNEVQVEQATGVKMPDGLWCTKFAMVMVKQALGKNTPEWFQKCGYRIQATAKKNGCYFTDPSKAQPGDMLWVRNLRGGTHTVIVTGVKDGKVQTISGNSSAKVKEYDYSFDKIIEFVRVTG